MEKTENLEQKIEGVVLVVDDQWGKSDFPIIQDRYGDGKVQGYKFELEDAWNGQAYDKNKVVQRVRQLNPSAILLDLDFYPQIGYGLEIMKELNNLTPKIPVLMFSGTDTRKGLALIGQCLFNGAKEANGKASASELKEALDRYVGVVYGR